ncbi:hypothetical protein O181_054927 [Austropuccinia psidii MF-1]|uniref:Uncharacterized protein n=1 Tax=Austropuccinia psidii MF-1 TaxID=1389203 RepID=A0A9Q3E7U7_9BASI|nr:hypothetical protein [Austropuccinia psidii MF-1]
MEYLFLVWDLEKLHYSLDGSVFDVICDCNSAKSHVNIKTPNRHILILQIAIQEYRGLMTMVTKASNIHNNADGLGRWELPNKQENDAYVPANAETQHPI